MKLSFYKACFLHDDLSVETFSFSFLWLFYHFSLLLFSSFISTGKRYPFTSLVPNTQNYVTGTMKFQHVLLTYSDLWVLPPAPSSQHIPFHSVFLFFQPHSKICIKFALQKKKNRNLFYTFLTISCCCEKEEDEFVLC